MNVNRPLPAVIPPRARALESATDTNTHDRGCPPKSESIRHEGRIGNSKSTRLRHEKISARKRVSGRELPIGTRHFGREGGPAESLWEAWRLRDPHCSSGTAFLPATSEASFMYFYVVTATHNPGGCAIEAFGIL